MYAVLQEVVAVLLAFASAPETPQQVLDRLQGAVWISLPAMRLSGIAHSMWALSMMDATTAESWNLTMIWYLSKQALPATGTLAVSFINIQQSVVCNVCGLIQCCLIVAEH